MARTLADDFNSEWEKFSERRRSLSAAEAEMLDSRIKECTRTLDQVRESLHKLPNVVGTGVSLKFKDGKLLERAVYCHSRDQKNSKPKRWRCPCRN